MPTVAVETIGHNRCGRCGDNGWQYHVTIHVVAGATHSKPRETTMKASWKAIFYLWAFSLGRFGDSMSSKVQRWLFCCRLNQ